MSSNIINLILKCSSNISALNFQLNVCITISREILAAYHTLLRATAHQHDSDHYQDQVHFNLLLARRMSKIQVLSFICTLLIIQNLKESVLITCQCVELFFYSKGLQVLKSLKVNVGKEFKIFGHFSVFIQLAVKRPRHMACHLTFLINISSIYWTSCQYVI